MKPVNVEQFEAEMEAGLSRTAAIELTETQWAFVAAACVAVSHDERIALFQRRCLSEAAAAMLAGNKFGPETLRMFGVEKEK